MIKPIIFGLLLGLLLAAIPHSFGYQAEFSLTVFRLLITEYVELFLGLAGCMAICFAGRVLLAVWRVYR